MNPEEKAMHLFKSFEIELSKVYLEKIDVKNLCLFHVDKIIEELNVIAEDAPLAACFRYDYWLQVKSEIEKL